MRAVALRTGTGTELGFACCVWCPPTSRVVVVYSSPIRTEPRRHAAATCAGGACIPPTHASHRPLACSTAWRPALVVFGAVRRSQMLFGSLRWAAAASAGLAALPICAGTYVRKQRSVPLCAPPYFSRRGRVAACWAVVAAAAVRTCPCGDVSTTHGQLAFFIRVHVSLGQRHRSSWGVR